LAPSPDHELGASLARLIRRQGEAAFESGVASRRILAQVQDLLGADTTLASPLRDLLLRPGFRLLFSQAGQSHGVSSRDALLADLTQVYSAGVVQRLTAVLNGCLGLSEATAAAPQPDPAPEPEPSPPVPAPVMAPRSPNPGCTGVLIAVLSLLAGGLFVALAVLLFTRTPQPTASAPPASQPQPEPRPAPPVQPTPQPSPTAQETKRIPETVPRWQACLDYLSSMNGQPAQPGETWWPVVGPFEALKASRSHCREDAFRTAAGNTQIASFGDRDTAADFAEQLSQDSSHPYRFWVGEPITR
jgi:hypothetical protein